MAIHRKVPASEGVTRVEFATTNPDYPFVQASRLEGCQVFLEELVPRGSGTVAEYFTVTGADPAAVLSTAADHESIEATVLNEYDSGGLFEFDVRDGCPAVFLAREGALPRDVYGIDGEGHVAAEIPSSEDAGEIVEAFLAAHADARLVGKRPQPYVTPMFGHLGYRQLLAERLTERQETILTAAHEAGYYDWPREVTAAELAERFDISSTTLLEHLRAAERAFVATFFEEPSAVPGDRSRDTDD